MGTTYVWDWDNGSGAQGDDLAVGSRLSWDALGTWGSGNIARVGTGACWVSWGGDSDSCGGLGLQNGQYCASDARLENTYDCDSDWDTLRGAGNTLGSAGRWGWDNGNVTGAGGGSYRNTLVRPLWGISIVGMHVSSLGEFAEIQISINKIKKLAYQ